MSGPNPVLDPVRSPNIAPPPGATVTATGVEFAVYAGHADAVHLCLFDEAGTERSVPMARHSDGTWSTHVEGVRAGQRYGYRADGPWSPREGLRHNPAKLLVDPYARAIEGDLTWTPEIFGHVVDESLLGDGTTRDDRDSAASVPRSVVLTDGFDWAGDRPPHVPWQDTVVYETHVVGLTRRLDGVPEHLRGTYAGVAHPVTIEHLRRIGVTSVELLPVHSFVSELHLAESGLTNYWGYNTLGYFAPHAAYASANDPQGVLDEFKGMVKLLHAAGIEVLLDVVYNHTCEDGSYSGPTLSLRGLDNRVYYRLDDDGRDQDVTGCGNTVDLTHPVPMRLVLDSLRYWVQEMHVDGFRFDLAVALGRGKDGEFHPDHPFLMALRTDPVLAGVKLIAEPWDVGHDGWRTGQLPPPFSEWNDRFRDTARTFWLPDLALDEAGRAGSGVHDLATRLAGSGDLFGRGHRSPLASINVVTAHDGFSLADLTAYDRKHNEANGEGNRDGSDNNRSWNHGVEGYDDVPAEVAAVRRRSMRNLLATLLVSSGVPMLRGGDEIGLSQDGNNNAYCQDNEIAWYDWNLEDWQGDLLETTAFLSRLRGEHVVLRQRQFFPGDPIDGDELAALHWHGPDGGVLTPEQWEDGSTRTLAVVFDGADVGDSRLLMVLHGASEDARLTLPRQADVAGWNLLWDSRFERPEQVPQETVPTGGTYDARAASFAIFEGRP
ncbi:glycogen debranching protein GlgX [Luteipulveratus flavus]|uniref:Glycogen debranching protein GlgX n=1 Tax=Luteipulveratus flavus TaxID=3031728 RepID=A0ABT6C963_9MICO|nr:glycogen debranching protein GlgX [Luteipulveratus sp. YIM 133296]MDF8265458.1 glycogen debranching protein GlgX [Luteipulveratus sp. YIM 133296]